MSSSTAVAAYQYWGYLIRPDKSPTPVLEQLLLGVANYIVSPSPIFSYSLSEKVLLTYVLPRIESPHRTMGRPMPDPSEIGCLLPSRRR